MNRRAQIAATGIRAAGYELPREGSKVDYQYGVSDMLTDLRHLCDETGLDFVALDNRAYKNYCAESVAERFNRYPARKGAKHVVPLAPGQTGSARDCECYRCTGKTPRNDARG